MRENIINFQKRKIMVIRKRLLTTVIVQVSKEQNLGTHSEFLLLVSTGQNYGNTVNFLITFSFDRTKLRKHS